MLFSPAEVIVTAIESGESFRARRGRSGAARCLVRLSARARAARRARRVAIVDRSAPTGMRASSTKALARARRVAGRDAAAGMRVRHRQRRRACASPGFGDRLPDAVLVRTIAGGSFEAVTMRLGVLHALRELGVPVWNDARAIERCVDKSMTSFLLARAGIPTPPTWAVESASAARSIVRARGGAGPLVLKPLFGSQGRGLRLIRDAGRAAAARATSPGVYYLQRFVGVERRRLSRLPPARVARPRRRRDDAARGRLDHQCQARRPAA